MKILISLILCVPLFVFAGEKKPWPPPEPGEAKSAAPAEQPLPVQPPPPAQEPPSARNLKTWPAATESHEGGPAGAAKVPRENYLVRNRSSYDSLFWVGGEGGIVFHGTGAGGVSGVNARLKFGRCGLLGSWHMEKITVWDPADVRNSILGLGAMCTVYQAPDRIRALRGVHAAVSLMGEYGETTYHVYEHVSWYYNRETFAAHETALGGRGGVDIYFPLLWGFWVNGGWGKEWLNFKYNLSSVPGNKTVIESLVDYVHVGISYGI